MNTPNKHAPRAVRPTLQPHPDINNIIAVMSAKGGVGKSTLAYCLASGLRQMGAEVGLLDADIYGPSQPDLLGQVDARPVINDNKTMQPVFARGLHSMSIGYLVAADQAMIWRGPMVTQALTQLYTQTAWPKLDYLIVDMPPGTGDIALTLTQKIPVAGVVLVTTPQTLAVRDVARGAQMLRKVDVPVLGLVENMSGWQCGACGETEPSPQNTALEALYAETELVRLAAIPYSSAFVDLAEAEGPLTHQDELSSPEQAMIQTFAESVVAQLAERPRDYRQSMPGIQVQTN